MSKYINPYTDFGFKRLFGTEGNKNLLMDFLNSMMPDKHKIVSLTLKNTEKYGEFKDDRKAFFDIHCQAVNGELFIVEMQKAKVKYFKDRALFYSTFPIREQAQKGEWDFNLLPVYFIAILDFEYDEKEEIRKFDRNVQLRDEEGFVFYDKLGFRFLQMPYFIKTEQELESQFDKWCYFLKNLENFNHIPQILNEPIFNQAFKTAEYTALNKKQQEAYLTSKLQYAEIKSALDTSREEGANARAIQIARKLKINGMENKEISIVTDLPLSDIDLL